MARDYSRQNVRSILQRLIAAEPNAECWQDPWNKRDPESTDDYMKWRNPSHKRVSATGGFDSWLYSLKSPLRSSARLLPQMHTDRHHREDEGMTLADAAQRIHGQLRRIRELGVERHERDRRLHARQQDI
jgi:hypothetical protein